jgi:hypothetical protein
MSIGINRLNKPFYLTQKGWQGLQTIGVQETLSSIISSLTSPVFLAFQSLGLASYQKQLSGAEEDNEIPKQFLLREHEKILSYLRFPEKAPSGDWINQPISYNKFYLTPLTIVSLFPDIVCQAEDDPFFQLLERGADPEKGTPSTIECICCTAILNKTQNIDISAPVARAKKLLLLGVPVPKASDVQAWLRVHCRDELKHRTSQQTSGNDQFDTQLPPGWALPDWIPTVEKLSIPPSTPKEPIPSNASMDWMSKQREKIRPLSEMLSQYPLLDSGCCALGIYFSISMFDYYLTNTVHLHTVAIAALGGMMPAAVIRVPRLNDKDMKKLHTKALQNPLYAELWQRVEPSVQLKFLPLEAFLREGVTKAQASLARFSNREKMIGIYEGLTETEALHSLVFETANASQSSSFDISDSRMYQGYLEREEFVRITECIELRTNNFRQQILDFGYEHLGWKKDPKRSFDSYFLNNWEFVWEYANLRSSPNTLDSHADNYRFTWNRYAFLYYLRNPDKAPTCDWVNTSPGHTISPLQLLAERPDIATLWAEDPFLQLIDKGADLQSDLLKIIVQSATDPNQTHEERKVQALRAKRLLQQGIEKNWQLSSKEVEWLDSI